jgi:hypothetical protein
MKQCKTCGKLKDESLFEKTKKVKSGIGANCIDCHKKYMRDMAKKYYKNNPQRFIKRNKKWWKDNPEKTKEIKQKTSLKLKKEVFELIGDGEIKCACCGESEINFLSIDHKNNDGSYERKKLGLKGGLQFYRYVRDSRNPKQHYQILCFNCNLSKGFYGKCAHYKITK